MTEDEDCHYVDDDPGQVHLSVAAAPQVVTGKPAIRHRGGTLHRPEIISGRKMISGTTIQSRLADMRHLSADSGNPPLARAPVCPPGGGGGGVSTAVNIFPSSRLKSRVGGGWPEIIFLCELFLVYGTL